MVWRGTWAKISCCLPLNWSCRMCMVIYQTKNKDIFWEMRSFEVGLQSNCHETGAENLVPKQSLFPKVIGPISLNLFLHITCIIHSKEPIQKFCFNTSSPVHQASKFSHHCVDVLPSGIMPSVDTELNTKLYIFFPSFCTWYTSQWFWICFLWEIIIFKMADKIPFQR